MRRLTKRALIAGGVGLLLVLAGSTAQAGWLFVLAAGVLGLIGGSALAGHRLGAVAVARSIPARARIGDEVTVGLTLSNETRRSTSVEIASDRFVAFEPVAVGVQGLEPGGTATAEVVRTVLRRGVFEAGDVTLESGAPFGFVRLRRTIRVASSMIVVPRWADLRSFPLLEPSSTPSEVLHERARTGAGEEYMGVREYRSGDPLRAVHWRSTARAGRLVVREFEEETASRVAVVVVGADHGEPPDSAFEALVAAAASIALYSLATGHPIDLVRTSSSGVETIANPGRASALDWLAAVEPIDGSLVAAATTALESVGRKGTVVLCTPTAGRTGREIATAVDAVQRAGSRAIVIAACSSTWEARAGGGDDEEAALRALGSGRALVRMLRQGADLSRSLAA